VHAGVPGADPGEWWGLEPLTTTAAAADPDRPVRVSPSRVESFLDCELRALMQSFGVADREAVAASLGVVIHALARDADEGQSIEEFERRLDEQWQRIDFGASWFADNERARASAMLQRLVQWLRDSRAELTRVGVERDFQVTVGDAQITGRVDRLERDSAGRLVVVDLKTGKSKAKDVATHPQLGTYQLAIEHGAFADEGTQPGGAVLVQLGTGGDVAQVQQPLADSDDPQWARHAVDRVAARMRGFEFTAVDNQRCHVCDVKCACPLQPLGRQVPQ
jgi:RecB family exonuclease